MPSQSRSPAKSVRGPRRPRRDLSANIVAAARHLFLRNGYVKTTIRDISDLAEIGPSGIFRKFPAGKYEILRAVYNGCWRELNAFVDEHTPSTIVEPDQRLCAIVLAIWQCYEAAPEVVSFATLTTSNASTLLSAGEQPPLYTVESQRFVDHVDRLCTECQIEGQLPSRVTAAALRELILGVVEGTIAGWDLSTQSPTMYPNRMSIEEAEVMLRAVLDGLRVQAALKRAR